MYKPLLLLIKGKIRREFYRFWGFAGNAIMACLFLVSSPNKDVNSFKNLSLHSTHICLPNTPLVDNQFCINNDSINFTNPSSDLDISPSPQGKKKIPRLIEYMHGYIKSFFIIGSSVSVGVLVTRCYYEQKIEKVTKEENRQHKEFIEFHKQCIQASQKRYSEMDKKHKDILTETKKRHKQIKEEVGKGYVNLSKH